MGATVFAGESDKELTPDTKVELPVYDEKGNKKGTRWVKAGEAWDEFNDWSDKVTKKYKKSKEKIKNEWVWDKDLQENVEQMSVPQEPDQKKRLDKQKKKDKQRRPHYGERRKSLTRHKSRRR